MNKVVALTVLVALAVSGATTAGAVEGKRSTHQEKASTMSDEAAIVDLFDRWEKVWEGQYDLIPSCVRPTYTRHDQKGDRTVPRDAYASEIEKMHEERPGIRIVVYDHDFKGDRAWFRFSFQWKDAKTGEPQSMAGLQSYRIADGKLAETWLVLRPLGSGWSDTPQATWTSPPAIK